MNLAPDPDPRRIEVQGGGQPAAVYQDPGPSILAACTKVEGIKGLGTDPA